MTDTLLYNWWSSESFEMLFNQLWKDISPSCPRRRRWSAYDHESRTLWSRNRRCSARWVHTSGRRRSERVSPSPCSVGHTVGYLDLLGDVFLLRVRLQGDRCDMKSIMLWTIIDRQDELAYPHLTVNTMVVLNNGSELFHLNYQGNVIPYRIPFCPLPLHWLQLLKTWLPPENPVSNRLALSNP